MLKKPFTLLILISLILTCLMPTITAAPPTVVTLAATNITATSVTLHGNLTNTGDKICTFGFEWGTTTGYGNSTTIPLDHTYEYDGYCIKALTSGSSDWTVPEGITEIDILVVAGGGGAGGGNQYSNNNGGAGGAGGLIFIENYDISGETSISYSIGAGGARADSSTERGHNGENTTFGSLTAIGGGGGGSRSVINGIAGGSGGGAGGSVDQTSGVGGDGIQSDVPGDSGTFGYGNDGANYNSTPSPSESGGGGGAGGAADGTTGGAGMDMSAYFGTDYGNNGVFSEGGTAMVGGEDEPNNTGNGGNSAHQTDNHENRCNGGSGIILIRYQQPDQFLFNLTITDLDPSTQYHYRAWAENDDGLATGADMNFTTLVGTPTVSTEPATDITHDSATLRGNLTSVGAETPDINFDWGATASYGDSVEGETVPLDYTYEYDGYYVKALTSGNGNWSIPSGVSEIDVLVVGAGGYGDSMNQQYLGKMQMRGGGGGAGGLILIEGYDISGERSISYSIGQGTTDNGEDTVFGDLTAIGGGRGGRHTTSGGSIVSHDGKDGGSGGGGAFYYHVGDDIVFTSNGGSSTQPTTNDGHVDSGFGNEGGDGSENGEEQYGYAGGGGGADSAGGIEYEAGSGKDVSSIFGTSYGINGVFAIGGNTNIRDDSVQNTGNGGNRDREGGSGIILIKYNIGLPLDFYYTFTDLTPCTTYHYRAWAENTFGRTNGSDATFTTLSSITAEPATAVGTTSVTLNGYIRGGEKTSASDYGFLIHSESNVSNANFTINTTASSISGDTFTRTLSLTPGSLYYVRTWQNESLWGFLQSDNYTTFLTRPTNPSGVSSTQGHTNITLSWINGSHQVSNHSTVIRYSTSSYPTTITGGIGGVNVSTSSHEFTSLDHDTKYYFSLWTYINDTASPTHHSYSPSYTTYTTSTEGGIYNITIRYENATHGPVDLTTGGHHHLIVHCVDRTYDLYFNASGEPWDIPASTLNVTATDITNGTLTFLTETSVREVEFYWNYTRDTTFDGFIVQDSTAITDPTTTNWITLKYVPDQTQPITVHYINQTVFGDYTYFIDETSWNYHAHNNTINVSTPAFAQEANVLRVSYTSSTVSPYRNHRRVVVINRTINVFILTDKKIYGETTLTDTIQNTLMPYSYQFYDMIGAFSLRTDNAWCAIFTKDADGNTLVIHSQYLYSAGQLLAFPQLLYGKTYSLAIYSDSASEQLGRTPLGPTLSHTILVIGEASGSTNIDYQWADFILDSYQRTDTQIRYTYLDTIASTHNVTFAVYYWVNRTLIPTSTDFSNANNYEYTFTLADGYLTTEDYVLLVTTDIRPDLDNIRYEGIYYKRIIFYANRTYSTEATTIDDLFRNLFGESPLYRYEDDRPPAFVSWTYILVFILAFFTMVTFSRRNGFVGMIATGFVVILATVFVHGLTYMYYGSAPYLPALTTVVGSILVAVGILGVIGGIDTS